MEFRRTVTVFGILLGLITSQLSGAQNESYSLFTTSDRRVIRVATGTKGEKVQLLANPQFTQMGAGEKAVEVPITPKNPSWKPVPDGSYKTIGVGATYVIKDSRIAKVLDRNGNDITSK